MRYELANAFAGLRAAEMINDEQIDEAWTAATAVPITLHQLTDGFKVVQVTMQLGRRSAYDAAYLALATELDADLWTLDGPLARNAREAGFRVHLLNS